MSDISGRRVFAEFRRQTEQLRGQAATLATEVGRVRARISELVEQRGQAIVDLSSHYLPDLRDTTVDHAFVEVRDALREIVARRDERVQALRVSIDAASATVERLEAEVVDVDGVLATQRVRLDELEASVKAMLTEDDEFKQLSTAAAYAEERLSRNEARIEEIRLEAKEKLPGYEKNRLFMYLVARKFGSPDYGSRGLIRRLDRWVARLVRFEEFKPSYDFLRVTPEIVEAELERRRGEFEALMDKVEEIERRYSEEVGLTAAATEFESLTAERDRLREKVDAERVSRSTLEEEFAKIEKHEGRFHAEATARFRAFLAETRTSVLERHARQTPDSADDRIVASIERCNDALDDLEPELQRLTARRAEVEERARSVEAMSLKFRRRGYHADHSFFDEGRDPRRDIERWAKGETDGDDVWSGIRRGHRERRPEKGFGAAVGSVLTNPNTWILAEAMVKVVGGALSGAAQRGVGRRSRSGGGIFGGGGRSRGGGGRSGGGRSGGGRSGGGRGGFSIGDSF